MKNLVWLVVVAFFIVGCSNSNDPSPNDASNEGASTGSAVNDDASSGDGDGNENGNSQEVVDDSQGGNTPSGAITANNTNDLILQAFDVLTARAYDARLTVFPYTQHREVPVSYGENLTVRRLTPRACDNAGQVSTISNDTEYSSASVPGYQVHTTYSDCLVGTETLNGNVRLEEDRYDDPNDLNEFYTHAREFSDGFTVSFEPDGHMSASGLYRFKPSTSFTRVVGVDNLNYHFSYPGGRLTVSDATTIRTVRLDGRSDNLGHHAYMSGQFKMRPPFLNGAEVSVEVTEPFINESTPTQLSYERGVMRISDANSELVIIANNGNADTVSITSTLDDGVTETREESWLVWMAALAFEPSDYRTTVPDNPKTSRDDVIRADNYTDILAEVFRVFNGDLFGTDILQLPRYPFPEFEPGYIVPNTLDGLSEPMTVSCTNGGSVELRSYKFGARQITSGWNSQFDACDQNGLRYEGNFYTRNFGNFNHGSLDGLSVTSDNNTQVFKGALDYKHTTNRDGSPTVWYGLDGDYRVSDSRGDYELYEASIFLGGVYRRTTLITGRFFLKSATSENEFLRVESPDPLFYDVFQQNGYDGSHFDWGTLMISAGDGNRLTLKANNGNVDTFDILIDQPEQAQVRETLSWVDWTELSSFNFDLHTR